MTADARLERILYILPASAREDGASVHELAHVLGVTPERVLADLEEATARSYHHPGGTVEPFSIFVDGRRVRVHAPADYQRPVRLNAREALALGLGLRTLAADSEPARRASILELAERLEAELTVQPPTVDDGVEYDMPDVALSFGDDGFRGVVADAIEQRVICEVAYLKAGDLAPERRRIAPYRLVYADGSWYVAAHDVARDGPRFFRMDRVLDAVLTAEPVPEPGYDIDEWLRAAPYRATDEIDVVVRYDARIARWILEQLDARDARDVTEPGNSDAGDGADSGSGNDDGSVRVRHRVADARWIVRHVLQYGGAAVIERPATARRWVADAARRLT
jgi:predicted DNA-binding transcriptional regulator YafY